MEERIHLKKKLLIAFHYFIYINLIIGFFSSVYMVFVVYAPSGDVTPLWSKARELPHEFLVQRRLYGIEAWITFGTLAIYFALTSYQRLRKDQTR